MVKAKEPNATQKPRHPPKGQLVGYVRVSTFDQNENRQLDGVQMDRVFLDKASGKDVNRPQLELMLSFVREGDTIICHSMDRLGRNLDDLRRMVLGLTVRGVHVRFVKESLTFTGEDSPMANLLLSVMGAFAQFERELIRERRREVSLATDFGFIRTFGEEVSYRMKRVVVWSPYAGCRTRRRKRSKLALPYIERLISLSRCTWPSTGPLLQGRVRAASTGILIACQVCGKA